jgi:hypothetical protein
MAEEPQDAPGCIDQDEQRQADQDEHNTGQRQPPNARCHTSNEGSQPSHPTLRS